LNEQSEVPTDSRDNPGTNGFRRGTAFSGKTARFSIKGMHCAGCAGAAERVLRNLPGIKAADISFAAERGFIRYDPGSLDPTSALKRLGPLGFQARLLTTEGERGEERRTQRTLIQLITAFAFGMQVMLLYLVQLYPLYAAGEVASPDVRKMQYLVWALATPALFYGGITILRGAWRALRAGTATMDTLVTLGTLSAYGYSVYMTITGAGETYFDSVSMIVTFIMIGRYLETLGGAQARKEIRGLLKLQPDTGRRRNKNAAKEWQEVPAVSLQTGDTILIKPGERVPVDGKILEGRAALDESLLTGESTPAAKSVGQTVFAGTVVTDQALICRVLNPVGNTRLAQITALVDRTLSSKPPIQRLADRAAAYFAFGILAVAVCTGFGWWFFQHTLPHALLSAVAVLVVACPCALGLATPLSLAVSLGRATRRGILVRNPVALETSAAVQTVVFDKTGTLTCGQMRLSSATVEPNTGLSEEDLLRLAAAIEQFSEHPLAKAIVAAAALPLLAAKDFITAPGHGASAVVESLGGRRIDVGSAEYVGNNLDARLLSSAREHAALGKSVVWIGWEGKAAGFLSFRDEPNETAAEAIQWLRRERIDPVLVSGDNETTVAAIARELDLEQYEGNSPPEHKADYVRKLQSRGVKIAMIGDGINDAPALAQADLSITAAGGTDVAGESSDLVLLRPDLTLIPWFINLSRRTRRIILQNLGWALAYNLVTIPLAAIGLITPVIAAVTMSVSSLLVVSNSLRLRRIS